MKVKYKLSPIWLTLGIIWAAISVYLFSRYIPDADPDYYLRRMITIVGLPILLSIYFFLMPLISYLKIDKDKILIHKSVIVFNFKIKRENLLNCRIMGRDLVFYTKNDQTFSVHLDWCNKKEVVKAIKHLQSFTMVYEGNTNNSINLSTIESLT